MPPKVLVIGLDGLEISLAERLMAAGEMPALSALARRSAAFRLDHGSAQRTGLAWEHVASGLDPEAAGRWAAVEFDPRTYAAWQSGAQFTPWWSALGVRTVVFDTPYVDLRRAAGTRGVVGWGAHDPGARSAGRPHGLLPEFERRFGAYPASPWTYGTPWPSPEECRAMGESLAHALGVRTRAARWLATERLPDWELFVAVAGEVHGAIEGLWHGVAPSHPLHDHPSAPAAGRALIDVHRALDRMVGEVVSFSGEASVVAFATGGMGDNRSDVQSMVLLPELLYRHAFGQPLLCVPREWTAAPGALPPLPSNQSWSTASDAWLPETIPAAPPSDGALRGLFDALPRPLRAAAKGARAAARKWHASAGPMRQDLSWQPALGYRDHWPAMPAFALPSFYDGRIRINLRGREQHGVVEPARYEATCQALETLLRECHDPRTGKPAVEAFERASTRDPLALGSSEADLLVIWRDTAAAIEHPRLGLVGPVPIRRTGGHTGPHGVAWIAAPGVAAGERGVRSTFDVAPTIGALLGRAWPKGLSGASLL